MFELPRCEGGNRKVTFRASIHTTYRDHKIKENPNGFLERIETIPTDKEHLSQDEVKRGKVFPNFKDSMTQAPLKNWLREGCMDSCKGAMVVLIL